MYIHVAVLYCKRCFYIKHDVKDVSYNSDIVGVHVHVF